MLAFAVAVLQLAAVPSLFLEAERAPLLPVALLAAWSAVQGPLRALAVLVAAAIVLGVASEERVGWFMLALLPTAAMATALPRGERAAARRLLVRTTAAAAVGVLAYAATLSVAAGRVPLSSGRFDDLAAATLLTMFIAALTALAMLPFRPRARGLFS